MCIDDVERNKRYDKESSIKQNLMYDLKLYQMVVPSFSLIE